MEHLKELENRIDSALRRIRAAGEETARKSDDGVALRDKLQNITAQNGSLTDEVASLRKKREADVQELDTLLAELKPLIAEVS